MSRKKLYLLIAAGLLGLVFLAFLWHTVHSGQVTSQALQQRYQLQDSFRDVLEAKEKELGISLRDFTLEEEDQMILGERTPEEVVEDIVLECATPAPVLSGKTHKEVTAEFKPILDACKKDFEVKMDIIIAQAKVDFKKVSTQEEKEELLVIYVEQIQKLEKESDSFFLKQIDQLEAAYLSVDGSIDSDDSLEINKFKKEFIAQKEKQMARFSKEYNK